MNFKKSESRINRIIQLTNYYKYSQILKFLKFENTESNKY